MKVSEITLDTLKLYSNYYLEGEDSLLTLILKASKTYVQTYTGLNDEQLDSHEDLTVAVLALATDMIDRRSYHMDNSSVNKILDHMLHMYSLNL